ncbi:tetratricopeptide repeat protein (macronuclear) [Tetrahymena thermophila SB210]|uniref:Tetratricopeptide repeat protein n=1 Tax=Tetrahymena thermophila (strain SB210) TaxID=312017 RepID=I7MKX3_TETTS|nr:tetratricopeptide repeat protein [Tetrahymena thermophila SB210]EAS00551.2 tetratricopeptide repeat protein [Tetrahymena thermophila SB210]|eukprot:XP_001020796.2 tetratricopeptide repeat protein [Tetrahymena thermophila SB210]
MELQKLLLLTLLFPILIISSIGLISTYFTYQNVKDILKEAQQNLLNDQIQSIKIIISAQKAKLDTQFIKMGREIQMVNNFYRKSINDQVYINPFYEINNTIALAGSLNLTDLTDPRVVQVLKGGISVSSWFLKNVSSSDFSKLPQPSISNIKHQNSIEYLIRSIYLANKFTKSFYFEDQARGFQNDGLAISNPYRQIRLDKVILKEQHCQTQYYDARCRSWYVETSQISQQDDNLIYVTDPILIFTELIPYLGTAFCSKIMFKNELQSVGCGYFRPDKFELISSTSIFSNGFQIITVARSQQTIFYQGIENGYNKTLQDLLFDKNETLFQQFISEIPQNFTQYQYKVIQSKIGLPFLERNSDEFYTFDFQTKNNSYISITTPINIIDKINSQQFQLYNIFTFYTIISKEKILQYYQELQSQILSIQIIIFIFSAMIVGIFSIISYVHGISIAKKIENPIQNLTFFLQQVTVNDLGLLVNSQFNNLESILTLQEELETQEVKILFETFLDLFTSLKIVSQTIYDKNHSAAIIELNQAIKKFSQRSDRFALGICYNNLGNILVKESRYQEAMENYLQSIIQIDYDLGKYEQENNFEEEIANSSAANIPIIEEDIDDSDNNQSIEQDIVMAYNEDEDNNFFTNKLSQHKQKRLIELYRLKFDRMINFSKAFKLYNLQTKNYLWKEYQQILEQTLIITKYILKDQPFKLNYLLQELSFCFLKQNKYRSAIIYLKKCQRIIASEKKKMNDKINNNLKLNQSMNNFENKYFQKRGKKRSTFVSEVNSISNYQSSVFFNRQSSQNVLISPRTLNQNQSYIQNDNFSIKHLNNNANKIISPSESEIFLNDPHINPFNTQQNSLDLMEGKIINQQARCLMFKGKNYNAFEILLQNFENLQTYYQEDRLICLLLINQCLNQIIKNIEKNMNSSKYIYYQIINIEKIYSQEIEKINQKIDNALNDTQRRYSQTQSEMVFTQSQYRYIEISNPLIQLQVMQQNKFENRVENVQLYLQNLKEQLKVALKVEKILEGLNTSIINFIKKFSVKYLRLSVIVDLQDEIFISEVNQIIDEIYSSILIEKYDVMEVIKLEKYSKQIIPFTSVYQLKQLKFHYKYALRAMYFAKTRRNIPFETILKSISKSIANLNQNSAKPKEFVDRTQNFIILFTNLSKEDCDKLKQQIINYFPFDTSIKIIIFNMIVTSQVLKLVNYSYLLADPDDEEREIENDIQNELHSTQYMKTNYDNILDTNFEDQSLNQINKKVLNNNFTREKMSSISKQNDQREYLNNQDNLNLDFRGDDVFDDFDYNFNIMNIQNKNNLAQTAQTIQTSNKYQYNQIQKSKYQNKDRTSENQIQLSKNTTNTLEEIEQERIYNSSNTDFQQNEAASQIYLCKKKQLKVKIFVNKLQLVNYLKNKREVIESLGTPLLYERL